MATNTTNFNLSKPEYTDTADIAVINSNMDKVDTSLQGLGTGLAIISNANTHVAITSGQYVYVHGHGSLAEGLYTAKSNISANATLSTSNLQAVSGGGLNALISRRQLTITAGAHTVIDENDSYICGKVMVINFKCHATSSIVSTETIAIIEETTVFDCVVPLFIGGAWSVSGALYGYVTGKSVVAGNISNGQYVHVNFTTLLA